MTAIASTHDETLVSFAETGSGSPSIVFVPGLTGEGSDFAAQVAHFSKSQRVVTIDLPGNGSSGRDRAEWSMAAFGRDVATVIDHLELNNLVLVGHSLGGDVVIEAGLLLDGRVDALVMVSSYRSLGSPPEEQTLAQWMTPFKTDFRAAMNELTRRNFGPKADIKMVSDTAERMMSAEPEVVLAVRAAKFDHEPAVLSALTQIAAPIFAINPDFKPNDESSFERHGVQLHVIEGVGHYTMMEAPQAFNETLADIVAGLPPSVG